MSGTLYLVATPIGNLEDMTYRAVRVLGEVDLIAAEDTRNSIKLLNHFDIHTPMTSYHEHNKYEKAEELMEKLRSGTNIAVISDAGTPGISDPGEVLVDMCINEGITVVPVPGACAAVNALISSGQSSRRFTFEGFLPYDKKERVQVLEGLKDETRPILMYEAPHKLEKTLKALEEVLGSDRSISLCKEITKKHENVSKTTIGEALKALEDNPPKGEYVLVISGRDKAEIEEERAAKWDSMSVEDHIRMYMEQGLTKKDAVKKVAADRNMNKREVYDIGINL